MIELRSVSFSRSVPLNYFVSWFVLVLLVVFTVHFVLFDTRGTSIGGIVVSEHCDRVLNTF